MLGVSRKLLELTPRQIKLCHALLSSNNLTQAALSAGYSPSSARTIGHRVRNNPQILAYFNPLQSQLAKRMKSTYEWKLKKLEQVLNEFMTDNKGLIPKKVSTALQAIAEMNKMQGHYSAEKHVNVDVKADADFEALNRLINQHAKDY